MRVLMLGWEFPPFISGGLGTACYGLTKAMSGLGTQVLFVLPKTIEGEHASHVQLISPKAKRSKPAATGPNGKPAVASTPQPATLDTPADATFSTDGMAHVAFKPIPSWLASPYQTPQTFAAEMQQHQPPQRGAEREAATGSTLPGTRGATRAGEEHDPHAVRGQQSIDYTTDIMTEVQRYATMATQLTRDESFDVIHAHDWMTYPAGMAIAAISGKPLVVHVHSTEFDRAGDMPNQRIYDIERRGMHAATQVICVSHLTRKICEARYAVPPEKINVVYNGIEHQGEAEPPTTIAQGDKMVLFLGRLTMQKGPEYFVAAAKKVLAKYDRVKFIVAGSGDLAQRTVELAAQMGIGHKVLFAGFLRGSDVERVFRMADVYVMPSVSEPFGIAPLEAIRHDVPVIISKNSGVAEVIHHALKVDFWDVDEMANKIIAVLRHPPLGETLREHADFEVRRLTWEGAAERCVAVYTEAIESMAETDDVQAPPTPPLPTGRR
jgi:glycogen(starch) synthase